MKHIEAPAHLSDNVTNAAAAVLRYAAYLFRKTSTFSFVDDMGLTPWEYRELEEFMMLLEDKIEVKE